MKTSPRGGSTGAGGEGCGETQFIICGVEAEAGLHNEDITMRLEYEISSMIHEHEQEVELMGRIGCHSVERNKTSFMFETIEPE